MVAICGERPADTVDANMLEPAFKVPQWIADFTSLWTTKMPFARSSVTLPGAIDPIESSEARSLSNACGAADGQIGHYVSIKESRKGSPAAPESPSKF